MKKYARKFHNFNEYVTKQIVLCSLNMSRTIDRSKQCESIKTRILVKHFFRCYFMQQCQRRHPIRDRCRSNIKVMIDSLRVQLTTTVINGPPPGYYRPSAYCRGRTSLRRCKRLTWSRTCVSSRGLPSRNGNRGQATARGSRFGPLAVVFSRPTHSIIKTLSFGHTNSNVNVRTEYTRCVYLRVHWYPD